MAVVRLRAKIETVVTSASSRRTRNVPMIDSTPIPTGRPAATTLPKTITSRSRVIGMATDSALARSFSTVVPIWRKTSAWPPTRTSMASVWRVKAGERDSMRASTVSSSPAMWARTRAWRASLLRRGGTLPRVQYELAWSMPGSAARWAVRARPGVGGGGVVDGSRRRR